MTWVAGEAQVLGLLLCIAFLMRRKFTVFQRRFVCTTQNLFTHHYKKHCSAILLLMLIVTPCDFGERKRSAGC